MLGPPRDGVCGRRPTLGLGREVFGEQLGQIAVEGEAAGLGLGGEFIGNGDGDLHGSEASKPVRRPQWWLSERTF